MECLCDRVGTYQGLRTIMTMKRTLIAIAGLTLASISSVLQASPIASFGASGKTDPQAPTRIDYYRPYYPSPYYRPYYRSYYYYNPSYIPYYYYGCRRFYSWGYLHCGW